MAQTPTEWYPQAPIDRAGRRIYVLSRVRVEALIEASGMEFADLVALHTWTENLLGRARAGRLGTGDWAEFLVRFYEVRLGALQVVLDDRTNRLAPAPASKARPVVEGAPEHYQTRIAVLLSLQPYDPAANVYSDLYAEAARIITEEHRISDSEQALGRAVRDALRKHQGLGGRLTAARLQHYVRLEARRIGLLSERDLEEMERMEK